MLLKTNNKYPTLVIFSRRERERKLSLGYILLSLLNFLCFYEIIFRKIKKDIYLYWLTPDPLPFIFWVTQKKFNHIGNFILGRERLNLSNFRDINSQLHDFTGLLISSVSGYYYRNNFHPDLHSFIWFN